MTTNDNSLKIKGMSPLLLVTNLNQSIAFYTRQLGFEVAFLYEDFYAGITRDGYSIHLKLGSVDSEERAKRLENEDLELMFSVADINSFYEDLQSKYVEFTQPLRDMPYGREFYIADPSGNLLGFVEEN